MQLHNSDAEKSILCSILLDNDVLGLVSGDLEADMFYFDVHKTIYRAMLLVEGSIDFISLSEQLKKTNELDIVGGVYFLTQISNYSAVSVNSHRHVEIIKECYILRELQKACLNVNNQLGNGEASNDIISGLVKTVQSLFINENKKTDVKDLVMDLMDDIESPINKADYISTQFNELNNYIDGFEKQQLVIIAGRPAMGKTAFALNITYDMAKKANKGLFFSMEMNSKSILQRMLITYSRISGTDLKNKNISDHHWKSFASFMGDMNKFNLNIIDGSKSLDQIRSYCIKQKNKTGLDFVVVDYWQMMTNKSKASRFERVSDDIRGLKQLATELDITVFALAQISRESANRQDPTPRLTDLRESGEAEQASDIVLMLHNDGYYSDEKPKDVAKLVIAKNRNGATGSVLLSWTPQFMRFDNFVSVGG